jgi:hypothetical protein
MVAAASAALFSNGLRELQGFVCRQCGTLFDSWRNKHPGFQIVRNDDEWARVRAPKGF